VIQAAPPIMTPAGARYTGVMNGFARSSREEPRPAVDAASLKTRIYIDEFTEFKII
jgi:hypothetical protein